METGGAVLKTKGDSAGRDLRKHLAHFIGGETSQERARDLLTQGHRAPLGMVSSSSNTVNLWVW